MDAALQEGVRLACEISGCASGAILGESGSDIDTFRSYQHDPCNLLDSDLLERAMAGTIDADAAIIVPLCLDGRTVGRLVLVSRDSIEPGALTARLTPLDTMIGMLLALATGSCGGDSLLSYPMFRSRVASEIAREERSPGGFCLLHMRLGGASSEPGDRDGDAAGVGRTLGARLRKSDVVGRAGADRLAILLTGTSRLGARIAARRVREILLQEGGDAGVDSLPSFVIRSFPEDGRSVSALLDVTDWSSDAVCGTALAGAGVGR